MVAHDVSSAQDVRSRGLISYAVELWSPEPRDVVDVLPESRQSNRKRWFEARGDQAHRVSRVPVDRCCDLAKSGACHWAMGISFADALGQEFSSPEILFLQLRFFGRRIAPMDDCSSIAESDRWPSSDASFARGQRCRRSCR